MGDLRSQTQILEPTIQISPRYLVEKILQHRPQVVGFGVYIWNVSQTTEVVSILKKVAPQIRIVIGGPEVSYEIENQEIVKMVDHVIVGEADILFRDFCRNFFSGHLQPEKIIRGPLPDLDQICLPYHLYSDEDIRNRIIYVEASRGCPYKCEYCLSSLDKSVRSFNIDLFLQELQILIDRGAREFKFVDRTFNLSVPTSLKILNFFLGHRELGLFLHFEMVPDRLPTELRDVLKKFPPGSLQFEVGIQTWSPEVAKLVSRKNDYDKVRDNFHFLNQETGIHTHADLIAGLPGETLQSFAAGFDELVACQPDEIQVGILKRLKGTPISRHDGAWEMIYQDQPPFQILSTKTMDYQTLQRLNRFSKYWDLYNNSGNFRQTLGLFRELPESSLFFKFLEFTDFLALRHEQTHAHSLQTLAADIYFYLVEKKGLAEAPVREKLLADYCYGSKRRDIPAFLQVHNKMPDPVGKAIKNKRQRNHLT